MIRPSRRWSGLRGVMRDPAAPHAARVSAATALLDRGAEGLWRWDDRPLHRRPQGAATVGVLREENPMDSFAAEVVRDASIPNAWRVEKLDSDGDGGVDVTIFAGPGARERATEYAAWKYGASEPGS
jgi:hypothetical protein